MDKFFKGYTGPVKWTNLRPMRLVDGKRKKDKEKTALSYSPESKGWTFECHMEYLTEVMLQCWQNNQFLNCNIDIGSYK